MISHFKIKNLLSIRPMLLQLGRLITTLIKTYELQQLLKMSPGRRLDERLLQESIIILIINPLIHVSLELNRFKIKISDEYKQTSLYFRREVSHYSQHLLYHSLNNTSSSIRLTISLKLDTMIKIHNLFKKIKIPVVN